MRASNNQLQNIRGLKNITHLEVLFLHGNKLENVDGLDNLVSIEWLDLANNRLRNIGSLRKVEKMGCI